MDKLINTFDRGFSLKNDDFRFIDASVRQALSEICMGLGQEQQAFVIWGAEVTIVETTATVTEGAIFYNNEIWHVPAHTFAVPDPLTDVPYWLFTSSFDAAGAKLDKDLVSHNTYELRKVRAAMTLTGSDVLSGAYFTDVPRLSDIFSLSSLCTIVPYDADPTTGSVTARKTNHVVTLVGVITQSISPGVPIHYFTVPAAFRSGAKLAGYISGERTSDSAVLLVEYYITNDGKFYAVSHGSELTVPTEVTMYVQVTYHI